MEEEKAFEPELDQSDKMVSNQETEKPKKRKITSIFQEYAKKIKSRKKDPYSSNIYKSQRSFSYKTMTNKLGLSKVGQIFIGILIISILAESIFFGSMEQDASKQIEDFESKITTANAAIEAARGVKRNSSDLTGKERLDIENSAKLDLTDSIGAKIDTVMIDEKIPMPGSQNVYYKVKYQYAVKDLDALKTLLAIVYLNPYVLKVTSVDNSYIYAIMTNTKIEELEK